MSSKTADYNVQTNGDARSAGIVSGFEFMSLGKRLRELRVRAGLSQTALAKLTGVSRNAVSQWEADATQPSTKRLTRLARALNLGRSDSVRSVKIYAREANVKLTLVPKRGMGADLELWAIEKEQIYFRELFGRTLSAAVE